jgi:exosortase
VTVSFASDRVESPSRVPFIVYLTAIVLSTLWLFWPYLRWLATTWGVLYRDTFGYLAPLISVWAVVRERKRLLREPVGHSSWGWGILIPGVALAVFSRHLDHAVGAGLALPFHLYGISLLVWGPARSRYLLFPILFCLFLYPWDTLVDSLIGFHLRLMSTRLAFGGLAALGMGASISGTVIDTGRFAIDVAPACSGLTTLNVLFFVGAVAAYHLPANPGRKCLLWASTVPLAVLLNTLRVVTVGVIGHFFGAEPASAFFHQISGLLLFGIGLLLLYGESGLLKKH